tara:strand:- start:1358 stop:1657 length:300 start_codon:yes stop_codon:yes gene_type:complete
MEFIRKQIDTEIQKGKVRPDAIYGILQQIIDHIEPPAPAPVAKPAPAPAPVAKPAPAPTPVAKPAPAPTPAPAAKPAVKKIVSPTKKAPVKKAPVKKAE